MSEAERVPGAAAGRPAPDGGSPAGLVPATSLASLLDDYARRWGGESGVIGDFRDFLASGETLQGKANPGRHITASAWIVTPDGRYVLLVHHRKLGFWLQPGGHTDPGEDWAAAALREAREETGLASLELRLDGRLFDLDIHPIPTRPDTPAHRHYDLRFLVTADLDSPLEVSAESHAIRWVPLADLEDWTGESSQYRMRAKTAAALAPLAAPLPGQTAGQPA